MRPLSERRPPTPCQRPCNNICVSAGLKEGGKYTGVFTWEEAGGTALFPRRPRKGKEKRNAGTVSAAPAGEVICTYLSKRRVSRRVERVSLSLTRRRSRTCDLQGRLELHTPTRWNILQITAFIVSAV